MELPEGFVTMEQFRQRIKARGEANPAFARNVAVMPPDWRRWQPHLRRDVFFRLGIKAVVMALGPDNEEVTL